MVQGQVVGSKGSCCKVDLWAEGAYARQEADKVEEDSPSGCRLLCSSRCGSSSSVINSSSNGGNACSSSNGSSTCSGGNGGSNSGTCGSSLPSGVVNVSAALLWSFWVVPQPAEASCGMAVWAVEMFDHLAAVILCCKAKHVHACCNAVGSCSCMVNYCNVRVRQAAT